MSTVLQKPTDYFDRTEIAELKTLSNWRPWWLILHCWATIVLVWTICVLWTNPFTVVLGIMIVGGRQLGLGILNHDGAHHTLFKNRALNDWVTEWLLNRPTFGASVVPYRKYHLEHHRHTQQEDDPDLGLSAPFPIAKSSFRRKVIRDLSGRTGVKQRYAMLRAACGDADSAWPQKLTTLLRRMGPNLAINLVFLAGFTAAGAWYLYFLLWVVPNLTWLLLISRVRNIGEHAVVPDDDDRLRNTRTTLAGPLVRLLVAPYWVNYHLEHHLLMSCPCYNLPKAHRILIAKGLGSKMEIQPNYWTMLGLATSTA